MLTVYELGKLQSKADYVIQVLKTLGILSSANR